MKTIIENIKNQREQLITKYWEHKEEYETTNAELDRMWENQNIKREDFEQYEKALNELNTRIHDIRRAINELGAALYNLSKEECVKTFWG